MVSVATVAGEQHNIKQTDATFGNRPLQLEDFLCYFHIVVRNCLIAINLNPFIVFLIEKEDSYSKVFGVFFRS